MATKGGDRKNVLHLSHVYKRYGAQTVLADICLDVVKNDLLFICGPSGAGKTTLLKLMYRAEIASEGQILVDHLSLSRLSRKQLPYLRRKFGIILQHTLLMDTRSVFDNVAMVLQIRGRKRHFIHKKVTQVLKITGLADRGHLLPSHLNEGEKQRLVFARAVVSDPQIIVADEPTGCTDNESSAIILNLLKKYHNRGATVIVASHNERLFSKVDVRKLFLKKGKLSLHETI